MNYTVMHTSIRINLNLFYVQILYTQKDQCKNEMLSQEKLMDKIKIRAMEKIFTPGTKILS